MDERNSSNGWSVSTRMDLASTFGWAYATHEKIRTKRMSVYLIKVKVYQ
jgi:hypothetical protein